MKSEESIIRNPSIILIRKNRPTTRKIKTTSSATKIIARDLNIMMLPFKVTAPSNLKITAKIKTKKYY
jgi:hypothetical protein